MGPGPTHTICPHCQVEIESTTKTEPGMIAYISGVVIALLGYIYIFKKLFDLQGKQNKSYIYIYI